MLDRQRRDRGPLDEAQLLGLATLIDEAVGDAFGRLRGVPREKQLEPRFKEVLDRVGAIAASGSIKERVKAYKDRLADVQKADRVARLPRGGRCARWRDGENLHRVRHAQPDPRRTPGRRRPLR